jgi:hypothetical protein
LDGQVGVVQQKTLGWSQNSKVLEQKRADYDQRIKNLEVFKSCLELKHQETYAASGVEERGLRLPDLQNLSAQLDSLRDNVQAKASQLQCYQDLPPVNICSRDY